MNRGYWGQKAAPWVSFTVLAGGLLTACILFFLVKIEQQVQVLTVDTDTYLEQD